MIQKLKTFDDACSIKWLYVKRPCISTVIISTNDSKPEKTSTQHVTVMRILQANVVFFTTDTDVFKTMYSSIKPDAKHNYRSWGFKNFWTEKWVTDQKALINASAPRMRANLCC